MATNKDKRERMLSQIKEHEITLARLAEHLGVKNPDGKVINRKLRAVELSAHKTAELWCNGQITDRAHDLAVTRCVDSVRNIFEGKLPPGFFINSDPRGYSLKIKEVVNSSLSDHGIKLPRDWGGYGLLSPDFRED